MMGGGGETLTSQGGWAWERPGESALWLPLDLCELGLSDPSTTSSIPEKQGLALERLGEGKAKLRTLDLTAFLSFSRQVMSDSL